MLASVGIGIHEMSRPSGSAASAVVQEARGEDSKSEANSTDLLPIVLQGTKQANDAVESGKGRVSVQNWSRYDGIVFESKCETDMVFRSEQFKLTMHWHSLEGELPDGFGRPDDNYDEILSFDGQTVRALYDRGMAEICCPDSNAGSSHLVNYEDPYAVGSRSGFGNGVCDLTAVYESLVHLGATGTGLQIVGRDTIDGDSCVIVECTYEFTKRNGEKFYDLRRFWINTDKGYTLKKVKTWKGRQLTDMALAVEYEVAVRQYPGGIWGPDRVESIGYERDKLSNEPVPRNHSAAVFDANFALNVPVTDDELQLAFPSGTKVRDQVLDATYTVP